MLQRKTYRLAVFEFVSGDSQNVIPAPFFFFAPRNNADNEDFPVSIVVYLAFQPNLFYVLLPKLQQRVEFCEKRRLDG